ncbi:MAG: alpha/beta hydrolase [Rhodospirillales bacterium]
MGRLIGDDEGADFVQHTVSAGDGLRLAIRDYGARQSPVVLCLTGVTRNARDFHPLASLLVDRFRVVVPDYRGRGGSEWDPDWRHYHPQVYLRDIADVLTALDIEHCAVVGTSLGGLLGFAMGVAMPTRIDGLLINDIGPIIPDAAIGPVRAFVSDSGRYATWEDAIGRLQGLFPSLPAEDDDDWLVLAKATFKDDGHGFLIPDWDPAIGRRLAEPPPSANMLWSLFDSLARRPLALVRGAESQFLSRDTSEIMQNRHPGMDYAEIENVGHAPSLVEPQSLDLVYRWLDRCSG